MELWKRHSEFSGIWLTLLLILWQPSPLSGQIFQFEPPHRFDSIINSEAEEMVPLLSLEGDKLYFARTFDPRNKGGLSGGQDIWISKK